MAAAEDVRYRQSSQYRLWSFSPPQLAAMREKTNSLARANISERLSSSPGTSSANTPDPTSEQQQQGGAPLPKFLTPADEAQLATYYTVEVLRAGTFCNIPTDMKATAAVFLRRFYITNSIMTYPPPDLLKTCLFFACKAEGWYQSATAFADNFPNTTSEEILAGEFLLCQGLRFAFDVKHPFRALEGAIMELRRHADLEEKRIVSAHSRAREILKFSPVVTDAYFHYTPSQIMLAALSMADRGLAERLVHDTFRRGGADGGKENRRAADERAKTVTAEIRDKVLATVEACRTMLEKEPPERMTKFWGTPESNDLMKPIRRKLNRCHDPDRWDLIALQKARREQQQQQLAARKGGGGGALNEEGDAGVFGGDLKRRKVGGGKAGGLEDPFGGPM